MDRGTCREEKQIDLGFLSLSATHLMLIRKKSELEDLYKKNVK